MADLNEIDNSQSSITDDTCKTYRLNWLKYDNIFKIIDLKEDFETYQKFNICCKYCASSKLLTADTRTSSNLIKHLEYPLTSLTVPNELLLLKRFKSLLVSREKNVEACRHKMASDVSMLAVSEDHLKNTITILNALNNYIVKAYFCFLKYSLNFFNSFNAMFQIQNIMIHKMYTISVNLLKTFAQNFIKPEFLMTDSLEQLSFSDTNNFLPESEIFVGTEFLKNLLKNEF
ncbi:hypothetical protein AGLY_017425 [Aphis glycines]|uniref:Uncharacterized protein n=1 Tax=Aphis glycines TaxID=307491 RepID=A0A6G0SVP2_APHGL|nr:hypothetical protein AGLY_017425 [Aphis glycines]